MWSSNFLMLLYRYFMHWAGYCFCLLRYDNPGILTLGCSFLHFWPKLLALSNPAYLAAPRLLQVRTFIVLPASSAFSLQPSTFNLQPLTFNLQPSTFNLQPSTFNLQPSTFNLQPSTFNLQLSFCTCEALEMYIKQSLLCQANC
jgi:hypothetical protein